MLAREQVEALARDFEVLAQRAAEIADGGEAFPVGVRELTSRMAADLPQKAHTLVLLPLWQKIRGISLFFATPETQKSSFRNDRGL